MPTLPRQLPAVRKAPQVGASHPEFMTAALLLAVAAAVGTRITLAHMVAAMLPLLRVSRRGTILRVGALPVMEAVVAMIGTTLSMMVGLMTVARTTTITTLIRGAVYDSLGKSLPIFLRFFRFFSFLLGRGVLHFLHPMVWF